MFVDPKAARIRACGFAANTRALWARKGPFGPRGWGWAPGFGWWLHALSPQRLAVTGAGVACSARLRVNISIASSRCERHSSRTRLRAEGALREFWVQRGFTDRGNSGPLTHPGGFQNARRKNRSPRLKACILAGFGPRGEILNAFRIFSSGGGGRNSGGELRAMTLHTSTP